MSAPNFALRNAKRYFIIEEPEDADYWFWNDAKEDLTNMAVENHGFEWLENDEWRDKIARQDRLDSYPADALECYADLEFVDKHNESWYVTLVPMVRSGYYSGATLDFYIKLCVPFSWGDDLENEEVDSVGNVEQTVEDYAQQLEEQEEIVMSEQEKTELVDAILTLIKQARDKFYEFAEATGWDEYARVGLFSNGGAVYTNLSEIKRKGGKQ